MQKNKSKSFQNSLVDSNHQTGYILKIKYSALEAMSNLKQQWLVGCLKDNPGVDRQIKIAENQTYYTRFMNSALLFLLICASLTF